jgi:glycerophosphoryl diester phosphodiesterase
VDAGNPRLRWAPGTQRSPGRYPAFARWFPGPPMLTAMSTMFLDHPRPLAFAHRGGAGLAPENSWSAFEGAVALGYRYLETDVRATADGVALTFHDATLARVTGHPGRLARMSYAEVAGALIGGKEPIPRLEDVLAAWPDARFNIDVKDALAIAPLAAALRRTNAWDRVCVVSFSAARLRATRRVLDRPVCLAAPPLGAAAVRLGGPRGAPGSHGTPAQGARRPAARLRARGHAPAARPGRRLLTGWLARAGVRCLQVPAALVSPALLSRAHALGLDVHAWTVNDRPTMERLLDLGVDGIMTDQTVLLREVLAARGQWR